MKTILPTLVIALVAIGCSGSRTLGTYDGTTFRAYHTAHLFAPSATVIAMSQYGDTKVIGFVGDKSSLNAIGPAAAQAVGFTAASNTYGSNLKPDSIDVQGGNGGNGGAGGTGGSSSALGGRSDAGTTVITPPRVRRGSIECD